MQTKSWQMVVTLIKLNRAFVEILIHGLILFTLFHQSVVVALHYDFNYVILFLLRNMF
jgi:hypothetical protein